MGAVIAVLLPRAMYGSTGAASSLISIQKAHGPACFCSTIPQIRSVLTDTGNNGAKQTPPAPQVLDALLPMLQLSLAGAGGAQREDAAASIGILVSRVDDAALKAMAVKLAGPLLRAMTNDVDAGLAEALVSSIESIFERAPTA